MRCINVVAIIASVVSGRDILFHLRQGEGGSGALMQGPSLSPLQKIAVITNQGETPLEGATVRYRGDTFNNGVAFPVPKVPPGKTVTIPIVLEADHYVSIDKLPSATEFHLVSKTKGRLASFTGTTDMSWFKGTLKAPQFDPTKFDLPVFNVLLFGQAGSGKTSFYNSVLRMLQSQTDGFAGVNVEPTLGGQDHVTLTLKRLEGSELPLALWDTYGLAHNTWQGSELEYLMNGKLPADWHKDDDIRLATTDEVDEYQNRPHAVLIFVTVGEISDADSAFMQNLKAQIANIVRQGINPLLLVTKLDNRDEGKCLKENWLCAPGLKEQVRQTAADVFGLPPGNVYPNMNYLSFDEKNFELDRNLYRIIHRALSMAQQAVQQEETRQTAPTQKSGTPLIKQKINQLNNEVSSLRTKMAEWRSRAERADVSLAGCKDDARKANKDLAQAREDLNTTSMELADARKGKMDALEKLDHLRSSSKSGLVWTLISILGIPLLTLFAWVLMQLLGRSQDANVILRDILSELMAIVRPEAAPAALPAHPARAGTAAGDFIPADPAAPTTTTPPAPDKVELVNKSLAEQRTDPPGSESFTMPSAADIRQSQAIEADRREEQELAEKARVVPP